LQESVLADLVSLPQEAKAVMLERMSVLMLHENIRSSEASTCPQKMNLFSVTEAAVRLLARREIDAGALKRRSWYRRHC
jgi:hypothetical protein